MIIQWTNHGGQFYSNIGFKISSKRIWIPRFISHVVFLSRVIFCLLRGVASASASVIDHIQLWVIREENCNWGQSQNLITGNCSKFCTLQKNNSKALTRTKRMHCACKENKNWWWLRLFPLALVPNPSDLADQWSPNLTVLHLDKYL